ncbi:MAG: hypothetical protein WC379_08615 [Methanoregula sp.]|jgi:hypothetical protein
MRSLSWYLVLLVLVLGVIAILASTFSGPVIYSLEKDIFPSLFHENTDALKVRAFNSTTDILPLMQDLLDYDGPIMLNINIRDMDQVKYYLDQYSKNNIRLKNLVINLDMTESEMDEFSKSKQLQQNLLAELMNSTIAMDELDSLKITYQDDSGALMSIELQQEAIRKRMHEISEQFRLESEKTQKIATDAGLDTRSEKEAVQEVQQLVDTIDKNTPAITNPLPRIPTLSLFVQPKTGKYGDRIRFSGIYSSDSTEKNKYPVTIYIDSRAVISATTDKDGIYSTRYEIGGITPGDHAVYATSGITSSVIRIFSVTPVNSTTTLDIGALYNRPEIVCTGLVLADQPVQNAPVDIISDYSTILRQTTSKTGAYQAQIHLSEGTHIIQARFLNTTYPIYSSRSPLYEVEAARDSILSIRLLDSDMSADELSLTLDPGTVSYKDVINITGFLSGKNPKNRIVNLFIDNVYSLGLQTGPDGSYSGTYTVEKIRAGNHTIFAHYREPETGEIYSESRRVVVNAADTITTLDISMTDGGTGVICTGNVTAHGRSVSSVPVELVWDDRNIIKIQTDATGSFRQKISLPVGNHRIFARFTSPDYPLIPSRSMIYAVEVLPSSPGLSLKISPSTGIYYDTLIFEGVLTRPDNLAGEVDIFIENNYVSTEKTDRKGRYSTHVIIEHLSAGQHPAIARSGNISSGNVTFRVLPVFSQTSLVITKVNNSALYECTGSVMAFDHAAYLIRKPWNFKDAEMVLVPFWNNPLSRANRPVPFAPVGIISNNETVLQTITDAGGHFSERVAFPEGDNRVIAQFINDSYPIFSTASEEREVNIPSANISVPDEPERRPLRILEPLAVLVILLLFIGGAGFYLNRKLVLFSLKRASPEIIELPDIPLSRERVESPESLKEAQQSADTVSREMLIKDPIFILYLRMLETEGLSTAAREVYVHFAGTITRTIPVRNHLALTPREFLQSCNGKPFFAPFSSFVSLYERVRYGGIKNSETTGEFEESIKKTDQSLEGEDH